MTTEATRHVLDDGAAAQVALIDIARASGAVCVQLPQERIEGRRVQEVCTDAASSADAITDPRDRPLHQSVQQVLIEATDTHRKGFFYLLATCGPKSWLVSAREAKKFPSYPKTDILDAVRLAKLAERGRFRASFFPPKPAPQLSDLTHAHTSLAQDRIRHRHRIETLEDAQLKRSTIVAELFRAWRPAILGILVTGERNPLIMVDLARRCLANRRDAHVDEPIRQFADQLGHLLRILLDTINHFPTQIRELDRRMKVPLETMTGRQKDSAGPAGRGNPWRKDALGETPNAPDHTDTLLDAHYRCITNKEATRRRSSWSDPLGVRESQSASPSTEWPIGANAGNFTHSYMIRLPASPEGTVLGLSMVRRCKPGWPSLWISHFPSSGRFSAARPDAPLTMTRNQPSSARRSSKSHRA
ncbi:transposase [Kitasatospora misakiensis]|uniref:Transposase n=1 Tax=Kitasatospora misakiensis TaxID=67330 RepID=A0ABW0X7C4_9ACTN